MWLGPFRWSAQIISWAGTLIVIRLLVPTDYGIIGMTTYFIGLTAALSEFGIGSSGIIAPLLSTIQIRQLNALAEMLGLTGSLLALAAAAPVSRYFGELTLVTLLPVLGISFLIDGLRAEPRALMSKELDYRRAASSDFARALVFYASLQSIMVTVITLLNSIGKTSLTMKVALLNLLILPVAFAIGGWLGGITGIALAWAVAYPFVMALPFRAMLRALDIRFCTFLSSFRGPVLTVRVMSATVLGFRWLAHGVLRPGVELSAAVLGGAAAAGLTVIVVAREQLTAIRALIRREAPASVLGVVR